MKKSIFIGIGIFILGYIFILIVANLLANGDGEHSYEYGIICAIIFLAAIVGTSASLILKKIDLVLKSQDNKKK
ncbi:MAG: hypothetical protein ABF633_15600 [Clostridium sp.]|uniref:hypothetical protein n=1 Tax=Clostridium sp. TaxID=1506 RepID=UPI0039E89A55